MSDAEKISEVPEVPEVPEVAEVQEEKSKSITIKNLLNVRNLLDIAVERGAFKATEMSVFGTIYDEFSQGLDEIVRQSNEEQKAAETDS